MTRKRCIKSNYGHPLYVMFQLLVYIMDISSATMCKETSILSASSSWQTVTFPSQVHHHSNITDLCWVISASHPEINSIIELHVNDDIIGKMDMSNRCSGDFLAILDGSNCGDIKNTLEKFCISHQSQIFSSKPQMCIHVHINTTKTTSSFKAKFRKALKDDATPPVKPHIRNTVIYIMSITSYLIFTISLRLLCNKRGCCHKRTAVSHSRESDYNTDNTTQNTETSEVYHGGSDQYVPYTISGAMTDYPKPPPYSPRGPPPPYTSTVDLQNSDSHVPHYAQNNEDITCDTITASTLSNATPGASNQQTTVKTEQDQNTRF